MTTTIGSLDLNAFSDLYSDSNQYFWFESNSSATYGAGVHVTLVPDTTFISNPTGQNILMNTDGLSIRNGLLPMMTLDNNSLDFNVVDTTAGTYTTTATFTATGAQIGQDGSAHSVIDADGQRFYASNGTTQLANIGYGEGSTQIGTDIAPYYTLGTRYTTTAQYSDSATYWAGDMCVHDDEVYVCVENIRTPEQWTPTHWMMYIGNYSLAEGRQVVASGLSSHAEGSGTKAIGSFSHAEGMGSIAHGAYSHAEGQQTGAYGNFSHAEGFTSYANGIYSHAEGYNCSANGDYSHAEGYYTRANSDCSHAGGQGTIASGIKQTSIGSFNEEDTNDEYALIIGNGTSNNARSNALTVDWNGNVEAAGTINANVSHPTVSITASVGTLISASAYKFGRVVHLNIVVRKTTATPAGKNLFEGTLNTDSLKPIQQANGVAYYGARALVCAINSAGTITYRNASASQIDAMVSPDTSTVTLTYISKE